MLPIATLIALLLLGWSYLRIAACTMNGTQEDRPLTDDRLLPRYSLIVPLYREARIVGQLVAALDALDYPREKLQVLLVIEPDDAETAAALARHANLPGFDVIVAPDMGPRTKPKALNAALAFATGQIIGVYDAEDVPDPLQLRKVCNVLRGARGEKVGCVQARLAIDNMADSWITRQFAADYAGHFDVVLPMLGRLEVPVPLGGTSNHFRREVLERMGAWDPYNVTEDADLGVRLAREGWRTAVIASATDEEAPRRERAWLLQRTRWYKGWMQTLLVHGRHPVRLAREAGWGGALALLMLLGGGVTAALMHPFFALALLVSFLMDHRPIEGSAGAMLQGLGIAVLVLGSASAFMTTLVGMKRRGLPGLWRVAPLIPAYWLMMSLAAWRALYQLLVAPTRWEKTAHGFARTSRRLRITGGRGSGAKIRGSGAGRRRPLRASASG
jgi:glycosyltransferase XagB